MARILYGIMGNTHGHIMRTRSIVEKWKREGHEFLFVGGGRVPDALSGEYEVHEVPVLRTVHRKQSVDITAVVGQAVRRVLEIPGVTSGIVKRIGQWQPDLAICDREFFLPFACMRTGLRCVSVNHSHVLMVCRYCVPREARLSHRLAMLNDRLLFNYLREACVVSFYHPPLRPGINATLFRPVLRPEVKAVTPAKGDHILVYQTSPTFGALIDSLKKVKRPVVVYGFRNERTQEGNVTFKPYDLHGILEDLSTCAYAIVNGGHNLVCEALYFGKPVFCFPIANLFEQFLNSYYVREMGYGDYSLVREPAPELFEAFEKRLPEYSANVERGNFDGTDELVAHLQGIVEEQLK